MVNNFGIDAKRDKAQSKNHPAAHLRETTS